MRLIFTIAVFLALLGAYAWNIWLSPGETLKPVSQLSFDIQSCDGVASKAAAQLPPAVVEFQKLEYAGRQAHVFQLCMQDHGYAESAAWLKEATALAEKNATTQQISQNEFIEQLRRKAMMQEAPNQVTVGYWVASAKK